MIYIGFYILGGLITVLVMGMLGEEINDEFGCVTLLLWPAVILSYVGEAVHLFGLYLNKKFGKKD